MQEMIRVAVDAMGGDNAPAEMVKGAVDAVTTTMDDCFFFRIAITGGSAVSITSPACWCSLRRWAPSIWKTS